MADLRITVAMMVKNEEELLPIALESVKDLADEIIVVDTGSTDRTIEIAKSAGAKIFHHPWESDFAKHRNQTIEYSSGDWIFILDADEELVAGGAEKLREAIKDNNIPVIHIPVVSAKAGGEEESTHNSLRFFKADLGLRYSGAVHNQIEYSGESKLVDAKLLHHGYNLSREKMVAKFHRTANILKNEIAKDPENPKWYHYLALSYHTEKLFNDVIENTNKSIKLCGDNQKAKTDWILNYFLLSSAYFELNNLEYANQACLDGIAVFKDYIDVYAVQTSIAFRRGDSDLLKSSANKYLELHDAYQNNPAQFKSVAIHTFDQRYLVVLRLAMDARRREDAKSFVKYYEQAGALAKEKSEAALSIANYLMENGEVINALQFMGAEVDKDPGNLKLVEKFFTMLLEAGKADDAKLAIEAALEAGIEESQIRKLEGLFFLITGNFKEAHDVYKRIVAADNDNVDAKTNMALTLEKLDKKQEAESLYHECINQMPEKLDSAINLAMLLMRSKREKEAIPLLEQVVLNDDSLYDIHLSLAKLYWQGDDVDNLLRRGVHIARALRIPLEGEVDSAKKLGEVYFVIAEQLNILKQSKASVIAYEIATNLVPENGMAHLKFGEALLLARNTTKAIVAFEQAAKCMPNSWRPFDGLGRSYSILGITDAVEMCRKKVAELKKD